MTDVDLAKTEQQFAAVLAECDSRLLLEELKRRGGHPGALAEAALLCERKSRDYNRGMGERNMHTVDRSAYFPLGVASHAQMIHTKALRFVSLARKQMDGEVPEYESLGDTALDLINYAGFYLAAVDRGEV